MVGDPGPRPARLQVVDHLSLIESESLAFLQACLAGDADAVVPGCPGWTATDLLRHMGVV